MRNPFEIVAAWPKGVIEVFSFVGSVSIGSVYKMIQQNETGIKMTAKKILAEGLRSLFVALIVFAVFDQFLNFNKFFTYMMCSLASSMSGKFYAKLEKLIDTSFDLINNIIKKYY